MSFTVNAPAAIAFTANGPSSASFTVTGIILTTGEDDGNGGPVAWDDITGKPSTFTPATHSHAIADTTGLQAALDGKAATSHSHAIADTTGLQAALDGKQAALGFTPENAANKGINGGYAELDSGGKVPLNRLPSTLLVYKGVWNATTNSPALTDNDVSKAGHVYNVGTAGTRFSITWNLGDWLIYNDSGVIEKSDNSDDVVSVNGQQGVVVLTKSDVGLGNVDNTSDASKNSATATLTNKRITKRTGTTTSSATPTINTDNVDIFLITAQAVDITSFSTNLTGTPTEGQLLWIAITGTAARAITWGASFESSTVTLPTTTVLTDRLDVGFVWNSATSKWRCVAKT